MTEHPSYPEVYRVTPARSIAGRLVVPSSKSITQRYFNLALLGRSALRVRRPLLSEDIRLFLGALETVGFRVDHEDGAVVLTPGPRPARGEVFCGNGGTMYRFLTAALATVPGEWRLDGVPRLRERPVGPLVAALRRAGAEIECLGEEGYAPLRIAGGTLRGGPTRLDAGASSQYLSALLMAGLVTPEPLTVEVEALTSEPYVDLTLDAIVEFGGAVERAGDVFRVVPSGALRRDEVVVEGDLSAAAYPAAAALTCGGTVRLDGIRSDSRQGDRRFLDLLARLGGRFVWHDDGLEVAGDGSLVAVEADLSATPDQVPTLAALAPFARGTTRITNVPHLRIKESDRLAAMADGLRRLGAPVEELDDGLVVPGVWADADPPSGEVEIDTYGDHRIAMAFALVGLRRPGVVVREPGVVAKSYPEFWRHLELLTSSSHCEYEIE